MYDRNDLSFLDRPEILSFIFYPRRDFGESRMGTTHFIEVEEGVDIGCRFYLSGKDCPSILYFHGNGETVGDYDWVSPSFNRRGINLFVADYRGYGLSDGRPTISNLVIDSHPIFEGFKEIVASEKCRDSLFLMGRSLGSVPVVELAYHYQDEIKGLIVESGAANTFKILFRLFGFEINDSLKEKLEAASNKAKIRKVRVPTLIIHAEQDSLIPLTEGRDLYENSGAKDKEIYIIPGADHNTIWLVGGEDYYQKIEEFVKANL
ncbi:MAG: alpha/beta hydrolase [Candidatus Lokiarchaeia archaeon]